jgi:hypothetical protein
LQLRYQLKLFLPMQIKAFQQTLGKPFPCQFGIAIGINRPGVIKFPVRLAAGAINSPQILMLSGIGNPTHLGAHGIDVRVPGMLYAVIARCYGLGACGLFLFCALFPERRERLFTLCLVLVLMVHVSIHTLAIAAGCSLALLVALPERRTVLGLATVVAAVEWWGLRGGVGRGHRLGSITQGQVAWRRNRGAGCRRTSSPTAPNTRGERVTRRPSSHACRSQCPRGTHELRPAWEGRR